MKVVQDVEAQHIMIRSQSGVIHVVNASHHVHQTVSALLSAKVCCIFEHLNICINVCFVCSGLTSCGMIGTFGSTPCLRKNATLLTTWCYAKRCYATVYFMSVHLSIR